MTREPRRGARRGGAWRVVAAAVAFGLLLSSAGAWAGEEWGWLGVRIRDLTEQEMEEIAVKVGVREGYGVVVAEIMKDTPAAASTLKGGDLIVAIDGRPVVETRALQRLVGRTPPGRELAVQVLREGQRREMRVGVGRMPPDAVAERVVAEFGFFVREPPVDERPAGLPAGAPIVAAVAEGSAAARGGLVVGDLILAVNEREVLSLEGFRRQTQEQFLRDPLRIRVHRRGEPRSLVLPPAQSPAH